MITLAIWIAFIVAYVLITAAALSWAARRVGSPRGRFGTGVRAILLLMLLNAAIGCGAMAIPESVAIPPLVLYGGLLLLQLALAFVVIGRMFRLDHGHVAPVGAYLALGIGWLALLMLVIRPRMTESYVMPAASMAPTIEKGDRFFVNKLLAPRRWDLVAYWSDPGPGGQPMIYLKRLVGLPGERLRFEKGQVYVNDVLQQAPDVVSGRYHASLSCPAPFNRYHDGETIPLGEAEYFFIGDNVEISADSRMDGPTDRSKVIGVLDLRYWPLSRIAIIR